MTYYKEFTRSAHKLIQARLIMYISKDADTLTHPGVFRGVGVLKQRPDAWPPDTPPAGVATILL